MKICLNCNRKYDISLSYCLDDGSLLTEYYEEEFETVIRNFSNLQLSTKVKEKNIWKYLFLISLPIIFLGLIFFLYSSRNNIQVSPNNDDYRNSPNSVYEVLIEEERGTPKFSDYYVDPLGSWKIAPLVLSTYQDKNYRTFLRESYNKPINFAGHYIISSTGCGTNCGRSVVMDIMTGKVYWFPETVYYGLWGEDIGEDIVKFRFDSKLIIFYTLGKDGNDNSDEGYLRYYIFEDYKFRLLKSVKAPRKF